MRVTVDAPGYGGGKNNEKPVTCFICLLKFIVLACDKRDYGHSHETKRISAHNP